MTNAYWRWAAGVAAVLLLCVSPAARGQEKWTWKDLEGKTRTRADLDKILEEHILWTKSNQKQGNRADLSGANLRGANLSGVTLSGAILTDVNLSHADLEDANLSGSDLSRAKMLAAFLAGADLSKALLRSAVLTGAQMTRATLRGAILTDADLSGAELENVDMVEAKLDGAANLRSTHLNGALLNRARLNGAQLSGADLTGADLTSARIRNGDVTEADFSYANLSGTIFEPNSNPSNIRGIATSNHLELVRFIEFEDALAHLRTRFRDDNFREQERKITYALKRTEADLLWLGCVPWAGHAWLLDDEAADIRSLLKPAARGAVLRNCIAYGFNRIFFDLTCQYGLNPGRPLAVVMVLWAGFSLIYAGFIHFPGTFGLYLIGKRVWKGRETEQGIKIRPREIRSARRWDYTMGLLRREWHVLRAATCFSLLSAFNVGFREFNVGHWLRLLMKREYDIRALGWARTLAGIQSLISVYLVALWLLTYFGRPFE